MRNKFPILCCYCGTKCNPGEAEIWKGRGGYVGRCESDGCKNHPNQVKGRKKLQEKENKRKKAQTEASNSKKELDINKMSKKQLQELVNRLAGA